MKKTVMSAEALGVLLKTPELKAPETELKEETLTPDKEEATTEAVAEVVEPVVETQLQAEIDVLKTSIVDMEAAAAAVEAAHAEELVKVLAQADPLKEIVAGQLKVMRIGLSLADVDMADWSIETMVKEYTATSKSFMKSMPVGSVIPEKHEEITVPTKSSIDASAFRALNF